MEAMTKSAKEYVDTLENTPTLRGSWNSSNPNKTLKAEKKKRDRKLNARIQLRKDAD